MTQRTTSEISGCFLVSLWKRKKDAQHKEIQTEGNLFLNHSPHNSWVRFETRD